MGSVMKPDSPVDNDTEQKRTEVLNKYKEKSLEMIWRDKNVTRIKIEHQINS